MWKLTQQAVGRERSASCGGVFFAVWLAGEIAPATQPASACRIQAAPFMFITRSKLQDSTARLASALAPRGPRASRLALPRRCSLIVPRGRFLMS